MIHPIAEHFWSLRPFILYKFRPFCAFKTYNAMPFPTPRSSTTLAHSPQEVVLLDRLPPLVSHGLGQTASRIASLLCRFQTAISTRKIHTLLVDRDLGHQTVGILQRALAQSFGGALTLFLRFRCGSMLVKISSSLSTPFAALQNKQNVRKPTIKISLIHFRAARISSALVQHTPQPIRVLFIRHRNRILLIFVEVQSF